MKDEANKMIRNADYEVFTTNGVPRYLEYTGGRLGWHVVRDAQRGDVERCHRLEVRETRDGFQVHNVSFERAVDWREWRQTGRELKGGLYQSKLEAVRYVKDYGREAHRVNISQDKLGKWHWECPYYEVFTSRGFPSQTQVLDDAQRFLAEQRGEIEHEI